jgi:hypothetical protein
MHKACSHLLTYTNPNMHIQERLGLLVLHSASNNLLSNTSPSQGTPRNKANTTSKQQKPDLERGYKLPTPRRVMPEAGTSAIESVSDTNHMTPMAPCTSTSTRLRSPWAGLEARKLDGLTVGAPAAEVEVNACQADGFVDAEDSKREVETPSSQATKRKRSAAAAAALEDIDMNVKRQKEHAEQFRADSNNPHMGLLPCQDDGDDVHNKGGKFWMRKLIDDDTLDGQDARKVAGDDILKSANTHEVSQDAPIALSGSGKTNEQSKRLNLLLHEAVHKAQGNASTGFGINLRNGRNQRAQGRATASAGVLPSKLWTEKSKRQNARGSQKDNQNGELLDVEDADDTEMLSQSTIVENVREQASELTRRVRARK